MKTFLKTLGLLAAFALVFFVGKFVGAGTERYAINVAWTSAAKPIFEARHMYAEYHTAEDLWDAMHPAKDVSIEMHVNVAEERPIAKE